MMRVETGWNCHCFLAATVAAKTVNRGGHFCFLLHKHSIVPSTLSCCFLDSNLIYTRFSFVVCLWKWIWIWVTSETKFGRSSQNQPKNQKIKNSYFEVERYCWLLGTEGTVGTVTLDTINQWIVNSTGYRLLVYRSTFGSWMREQLSSLTTQPF